MSSRFGDLEESVRFRGGWAENLVEEKLFDGNLPRMPIFLTVARRGRWRKPTTRSVLPPAPEMIQHEDGASKNVCERNAASRFVEDSVPRPEDRLFPGQPASRAADIQGSSLHSRCRARRLQVPVRPRAEPTGGENPEEARAKWRGNRPA